MTRQVGLVSGNQCTHTFAPQKAVADGVSGPFLGLILKNLFFAGFVKSPNYPEQYPNLLKKTETIEVEPGLVLSLHIITFEIESYMNQTNNLTCGFDYLTIIDGDGTTLMEKSCGYRYDGSLIIGEQYVGYSMPEYIRSRSNTVNLIFSTNGAIAWSGWRFEWVALTQGGC